MLKLDQMTEAVLEGLRSKKKAREFGGRYLSWGYVSRNFRLTEDIIREFRDFWDWRHISTEQVMSDEFISEMADWINVEALLVNKRSRPSIEVIAELRFRR